MSFFTELRRRNVFKVGVAYAIVAWLLIQVAATVLPTFEAPRWVLQTITFLIILGFPLALFFAWAYELTPEGIKATTSEGPAQYHTRTTGQRLNYFILGVLILVVGFMLVDNYVLVVKPKTATIASMTGTGTPIVTDRTKATPGETISITSTTSSQALVRRTLINLGDTQPLGDSLLDAFIAVSRDGRNLVYAAQMDGTRRLYYRPLDQLTARSIPGTENAYDAFFSPDGEWVVYEDNNNLYKIAVAGSAPQRLSTAVGGYPRGAFWNGDDIIYFTSNGKLQRIPANGGTAKPVTLKSEYADWFHAWPTGLPDGTHLLLTVHQKIVNAREGNTILVDLATGKTKLLIQNGFNARYVPTGHIVFMRSGSLWAVPFDVKQLRITGPETPVLNGIEVSGGLGQAVYAFSDAGFLIYLPGGDVQAGGAGATRQLVWVDRNGTETPLPAKAQDFRFPHLSTDGTQVAVTIFNQGGLDIWVYNLARNILSRRTFSGAVDALWTPDGTHLVYTTVPVRSLAWLKADGTGQPEQLIKAPRVRVRFPTAFTPDGSHLVYNRADNITRSTDLYTLSLTGKRTEQPLLATKFNESNATLSPDGRWLAYQSDETGQFEIYVRPYPNIDGGKWQVSADGGVEPRWRGDGKELFYRKPGNSVTMFAVPVEARQKFQAGTPVELFRGDYYVSVIPVSFDVTADGQRFLFSKTVTDTADKKKQSVSKESNLIVVENWFTELKQLAPPSQ